jgi:hypothetical protein
MLAELIGLPHVLATGYALRSLITPPFKLLVVFTTSASRRLSGFAVWLLDRSTRRATCSHAASRALWLVVHKVLVIIVSCRHRASTSMSLDLHKLQTYGALAPWGLACKQM